MDENNTNMEKSHSGYEAPSESEREAFGSNSYDTDSQTSTPVKTETSTSGSAFIMPENSKQTESTSHQEVFGGTVEGSAANNYYTNTQAANYTNDKPETSNGFAIASLVMGILSILTCCCTPLAIILGILGIIFFCVQQKDSEGKRPTMATVGLILSIAGIIIAIGSIIIGIVFNGADIANMVEESM